MVATGAWRIARKQLIEMANQQGTEFNEQDTDQFIPNYWEPSDFFSDANTSTFGLSLSARRWCKSLFRACTIQLWFHFQLLPVLALQRQDNVQERHQVLQRRGHGSFA